MLLATKIVLKSIKSGHLGKPWRSNVVAVVVIDSSSFFWGGGLDTMVAKRKLIWEAMTEKQGPLRPSIHFGKKFEGQGCANKAGRVWY